MAVFNNRLIDPEQLSDSSALLYTVPANTSVRNLAFAFHNTDTAAGYGVTLNLVESGGSAGVSNQLLSEDSFIVAKGYTRLFIPGLNLSAGDKIYGNSDTASKITIHISGDVVQ